MLYLHLFHGRFDPSQEMDDWGFDGPVIGPVNISWTYGNIKVHGENCTGFVELQFSIGGDLIYFDGSYYGDFEICESEDDIIEKSTVLSFDQFMKASPGYI
ncbi:hypothetical protein [Pseudoflavitalea rhizosphaerae]|uniref:hypothetical protein n=1 Tax=Pseudoflavitalea rhizosphaerae TaxID=1884793 RepID=UPI000F8F2E9A|nr:hypothetical protein [Pseudoflavitalea rhizosphaerae]